MNESEVQYKCSKLNGYITIDLTNHYTYIRYIYVTIQENKIELTQC